MHQRLALFDLDGTLVDRQAAFGDAVTSLCRTHALAPDVERWLLTELADRANPSDFIRLCDAFSLTVPAAYLWQEYVDLMAAAVTCRPEVLKGLALLREAAWTVGIVTNGSSDIQRAKLAATCLAGLVDGIAVSGDLEIRKPDTRLFELAASRCGMRLADGGWMVRRQPGRGHRRRPRGQPAHDLAARPRMARRPSSRASCRRRRH